MEIQIDTREAALIPLLAENAIVKQLPLGDIIFLLDDIPKLIVERKTLKDLSASIKDGRYANQKLRLMESGYMIAYIIEGLMEDINEESTLSAIINTSLRDHIPVFQTANINETARLILKIKEGRFLKDIKKEEGYLSTIKATKGGNISPQNSFSYFLIQVPRVSPTISHKIVAKYPNLPSLLKAYEELPNKEKREKLLASIEGIGKVISANVYHYLVGEN